MFSSPQEPRAPVRSIAGPIDRLQPFSLRIESTQMRLILFVVVDHEDMADQLRERCSLVPLFETLGVEPGGVDAVRQFKRIEVKAQIRANELAIEVVSEERGAGAQVTLQPLARTLAYLCQPVVLESGEQRQQHRHGGEQNQHGRWLVAAACHRADYRTCVFLPESIRAKLYILNNLFASA